MKLTENQVKERWKQDIQANLLTIDDGMNIYEIRPTLTVKCLLEQHFDNLSFLVSHYALNYSQDDYEYWNKLKSCYDRVREKYDRLGLNYYEM